MFNKGKRKINLQTFVVAKRNGGESYVRIMCDGNRLQTTSRGHALLIHICTRLCQLEVVVDIGAPCQELAETSKSTSSIKKPAQESMR